MPKSPYKEDKELQGFIDNIPIARGQAQVMLIDSYIEKRTAQVHNRALRTYESSIFHQKRHYEYLQYYLSHSEISPQTLQRLYGLWEQDVYFQIQAVPDTRPILWERDFYHLAVPHKRRDLILAYLKQKLTIDEALRKREIIMPAAPLNGNGSLSVTEDFLKWLIPTLHAPVNAEITGLFHLLYRDWENTFQASIDSFTFVAQFGKVLDYIKIRQFFEALRIESRLNANSDYSELMKKHYEYLMLWLARKDYISYEKALFPLYQWYLAEYQETCKIATPAQLAIYQKNHEALELCMKSKRASLHQPLAAPTVSSSISGPFQALPNASAIDLFIIDNSNLAYCMLMPLLDGLNQYAKSKRCQAVAISELPVIKESLIVWKKIKMLTHPDKNREQAEEAKEFFQTVVTPVNDLLDRLKNIHDSQELEDLTNQLRICLQKSLTKITKDKITGEVPWEHFDLADWQADLFSRLNELQKKTDDLQAELDTIKEDLAENGRALEEIRRVEEEIRREIAEIRRGVAEELEQRTLRALEKVAKEKAEQREKIGSDSDVISGSPDETQAHPAKSFSYLSSMTLTVDEKAPSSTFCRSTPADEQSPKTPQISPRPQIQAPESRFFPPGADQKQTQQNNIPDQPHTVTSTLTLIQ